jgi:type I restriction enzyme S subunit
MTGTAGQQRVPRDYFAGCPVPLPPLAEQKRIVAKVDELMALCDTLEAAQQTRNTLRQSLRASALDALMNATSDTELETAWAFVRDNWCELSRVPEDVEGLRQAVLKTATLGKLSQQYQNDGSAKALLEEINKAKEELSIKVKVKRMKPAIPITKEEINISYPKSWQLACLEGLVHPEYPISYGVLVPGPDVKDGVPFVRIQDLSISKPAEKPNKTISPEVDSKYLRTRLQGGEILLAVVGASIGKLGIAPKSWAGANIARAVCRIVPIQQIHKDYLVLVLQTKTTQNCLFPSLPSPNKNALSPRSMN